MAAKKAFSDEEKAAMKERAREVKSGTDGESKARYGTFGFNEPANLDEGAMWPTAYALTKLTAAGETKIAALVKKAVA